MRMHRVAALAAALSAAGAAVAPAQTYRVPPAVELDAAVTPARTGTAKKPARARLRLELAIGRAARATTDQVVFNLPRDVRLSGAGFRTCPASALDATKNPDRCPKGSHVGTGSATAVFGPRLSPINFDVGVFAGSRTELGIWMKATNLPIEKAMRATISDAGRPYRQKLTVDIPPELRRYLGAAVHLTSLRLRMGVSNGARGSRRRELVRTVGCPRDRRHRFQARVRFVANPDPPAAGHVQRTATSACR